MTHERTLQTLKWAALLSILVAAAWGACGCNALPTSSTAVLEPHPNELLIIAYTQCYADYYHLGEIDVFFWEFKEEVECSDDHGKDAMCPVAGRAYHGHRRVGYWGPWVRGETIFVPPDLEWSAAHEVCHLAGAFTEAAAKRCAEIVWDQANCHDAGKQPTGTGPRLIL